MSKKIVLALAPTGGWGKDYHNPLDLIMLLKKFLPALKQEYL